MIFGGHRLDVSTRQVFRGATEIHLSPKAFDLLQILVENRTRALSKSELHDRLWPGTFVTEANLASLVAELRRALHDQPKAPRFVRTVHRFGYAFCGAVDDGAAPPHRDRACWLVWQGREIPLQDGENIIGRDPDIAVPIDAPSVSRRHARILVSREGAAIEDLGSKNGTLLKGTPVVGVVRLEDLDEVLVGSVKIMVRILRGGEFTQTSPR